ncbi:MAG: adenylosuccinate synthase [Candidatus Marinimicrobia bacterium]|nr:adenylosuccinate synthase [Candidatus Neomarinimicrobiota bacterium]
MSVVSILGAQWGDEGKGKIVDMLSENVHCVARFQGGANAGHTILIKNEETILHQLPSGVMRPNVKCVLGNGMVIDPVLLVEEIEMVEAKGCFVKNRIYISYLANVVTPLHKELDCSLESSLGTRAIGTTKKGIGPCYADKVSRNGLLVKDLKNLAAVKANLEEKINRAVNQNLINSDVLPLLKEECDKFYQAAALIYQYAADTITLMNEMVAKGSNILVEGAQGSLLDIDYGTYPFVTSSNTTSGNISTGLGIGPTKIDEIIGVFKAYQTRVGAGPFPTEQLNEIGEKLQQIGGEIGATTKRKRRCGWFDAVLAKYTNQINGFTSIILTKLDVLDDFDEIKICTDYANGNFPEDNLEGLKPEYITLPGWKTDISDIRKWEDLPANTKNYVETIERLVGVKASRVSVGKERDQIIEKK